MSKLKIALMCASLMAMFKFPAFIYAMDSERDGTESNQVVNVKPLEVEEVSDQSVEVPGQQQIMDEQPPVVEEVSLESSEDKAQKEESKDALSQEVLTRIPDFFHQKQLFECPFSLRAPQESIDWPDPTVTKDRYGEHFSYNSGYRITTNRGVISSIELNREFHITKEEILQCLGAPDETSGALQLNYTKENTTLQCFFTDKRSLKDFSQEDTDQALEVLNIAIDQLWMVAIANRSVGPPMITPAEIMEAMEGILKEMVRPADPKSVTLNKMILIDK